MLCSSLGPQLKFDCQNFVELMSSAEATLLQLSRSDDKRRLIETEPGFKSYLSTFLEYLQIPKRSSLFSNPAKTFNQLLKCFKDVILASTTNDYNTEFIPIIQQIFVILFNPFNSPDIRLPTIDIYFELVQILGENTEQYTEGFEDFIFDFMAVESLISKKPSFNADPNSRIAINETPVREEKLLIQQIDQLLNHVKKLIEEKGNDTASENDILRWWKIIQKLILSICYYSIGQRFKLDNSIFGFLKSCPNGIHKSITGLINCYIEKPNLLFKVLNFENAPYYIIGIIEQTSIEQIQNAADSVYYKSFVLSSISTLIFDENILTYLNTSFHPLIKIGIDSLLNTLNNAFSLRAPISSQTYIKEITISILEVIKHIFGIYTLDYQVELCQQLADWCNQSNQRATTRNFDNHLTFMLLATLVNLQITEKKIWDTVANGSQNDRLLYLSACAYFSSYYAINLAHALLQFDFILLQKAVKDIHLVDSWRLNHGMWLQEFDGWSLETSTAFFKQVRPLLISNSDFVNQSIDDIDLLPIDVLKWDKAKALQNVKSMLEAFDWTKSDNADEQYRLFLVPASFINPLLRLLHTFPNVLNFDKSFLLAEFMEWVKSCALNTVQNVQIKTRALLMLNDMICVKSSLQLLCSGALADWYLLLKDHINNSSPQIKRPALSFACKSLLIGFKGSNLLIKIISDGIKSQYVPNDNNGQKDIASTLIAINTLSEISSDLDYDDSSEELKTIIKQQNAESIKILNPYLKVNVLMTILIEESISKREMLIDSIIEQIGETLKLKSIEDIFSIYAITFILVELEQTRKGSIIKILSFLMDIIEDSVNEDNYFCACVELLIDIMIYSSFLTDVIPIYQRLEENSEKWKLGCENCLYPEVIAQRLQYNLTYLSIHFNRYPLPSIDFVTPLRDPHSTFGCTKDLILRVSQNQISTSMPVGQFTWTFTPISPDPEPRSISEDVMIDVPIPKASESESQIQFTNHITKYFTNLYENQLSEFNIDARLYTPSDFDSSSSIELTPNEFKKPKPQNLPPSSYGCNAAAFMTGTNFFDVIETDRMFPAKDGTDSAIEKFDSNIFRHQVNISFFSRQSQVYPHFDDFKQGLGYVDPDTKNIIFSDCRHEFIFNNNQLTQQDVVIVWGEGMSDDELTNSYNVVNKVRIEIMPRASGTYTVTVYVNKSIADELPSLEDAIISKRALPLYVISQISSNIHIIEHKAGKSHHPLLESGNKLRAIRKENFFSNKTMLHCARTLLEKSNTQ